MKTNTLLALGAAGAAIYFLTRKESAGLSGLSATSAQTRACSSAQRRAMQIGQRANQLRRQIEMQKMQYERAVARLEPQIEQINKDLEVAIQKANEICGQ